MTFTSGAFLPFLIGALAVYQAVGPRRRWLALLLASYLFYGTMGAPYLLVVIALVTLASYRFAVAMERTEVPERRRRLLWLSIAVVLGALFALKYAAPLWAMAGALGGLEREGASSPMAQGIVSIGVSYYALQAISYLLDTHDGAIPVERSLGRLALYLSFFPKLVQGPIEPPEKFLPQLEGGAGVSVGNLLVGSQRFLWGLFQKLVVADSLGPFVEAVYGDVRAHEGLPLVVATYCFAAQLYFDFAGYTDMAIGTARLFGIRLSDNFRSPYLATSVAEFWRRWHMTFSTWLLTYVFRPTQILLRDWRRWGTPAALVLTFLLSGLWHGATWGFVVWGLLHGGFLAASILSRSWRQRMDAALGLSGSRIKPPLQIALTFHLVCLAWVFFRASSLSDAAWVISRAVTGLPRTLTRAIDGGDLGSLLFLGQGRDRFVFAVAMVLTGTALRAYFRAIGVSGETPEDARQTGVAASPWTRTAVYAAMFYLITMFGTSTQGFMYERF